MKTSTASLGALASLVISTTIATAAGCGPAASTAGAGSTGSGGGATTSTTTGVTTSSTGTGSGGKSPPVFLILMENHNWADVKNPAMSPYTIGTLLPMGAHAEQAYNPPMLHPSEPNYIWLEAGDNLGITDDSGPSTNHLATKSHLVTLLESAGHTWKSYQEDISGKDCPLTSVADYAPKHNPMVFFDDVTESNNPQSKRCIAHVRPYSELATDLAGTVADYNFITPNLCHDTHNSCPPENNPILQGDNWLKAEVPKLLASKAYAAGATIIITWDEGELGVDGPIGLIVLSKRAKVGYSNSIHYTHSSTLRTVQEMFGVTPLLGDAANATDLADLFTSPF